MDTEALLLPEPFSEKNIDGSPISKAQEGRALFKNPGRPAHRERESRNVESRVARDEVLRSPEPSGNSRDYDSYDVPEPDEAPIIAHTFDPERFEPPVDEKPGMIPNPMQMPPVKKKGSLEYDLDDYGDDDYGYSFDESSAGSAADGDSDYGYDDGPEDEDEDDYGADYGDGDGGYDDYGSDYGSGSDTADDYY